MRRIIDNNVYALKIVGLDDMDENLLDHAFNEVNLLASISHPRLVQWHESFVGKKDLVSLSILAKHPSMDSFIHHGYQILWS